jgi:AGZA family xanthine/uracil permease-like MFS transporter
MEKVFKIKERGSTVRAEILAGITTFFTLAYIVVVNPNQIAAEGATGWLVGLGANAAAMGQIWNAVFVSSILVAFLGTILYALYANLPYAMACGMGLNAFFCTCFVSGAYFSGVDVTAGYHSGLVIILISGIVFLILSVTGLRKHIAVALPECLKKAIPAGIGLFIAFIGFQNAGVIQANPYTLVQFADFHNLAWLDAAPILVALIGFMLIAILSKLKVKGSVIIGILVATILHYVFLWQAPVINFGNIGQSFKDFGQVGVVGVFKGESWSGAFSGAHIGGVLSAIMLIITFCLVDIFDTLGTLYGTATEAGLLDKNGDPIGIDKSMTSDSIATVGGAIMGTSTCTTFVESAAGVAQGGRTGLTSLVTSICLLACLVLSPIALIIPASATAAALIYVGVLMLKNFSKVDMEDLSSAVPAFLTLIMMPLTYSIANGIGIGAIAYALIKLFTGKFKKTDIVVTIIAILFILKFIFVTM